MKLQHLFFLGLSSLTLFACGEDAICDCIRASDKLTVKYEQLRHKAPKVADEKEVKELIREKKAKCREFEKMSGPEMLERKATCN
ncbi:hypothetical protein [Fluviicola sp.]|jgi:hypothetical protein|uniref:hypothetical protein n=1 Tax=Fluviicola sp. TaxID=1917219 RepID=UPI00282667E4|nr:hypothetical protein [Fluviicola sp.]MDR0801877.1 hypothetical protein [Fluviicola sp.]